METEILENIKKMLQAFGIKPDKITPETTMQSLKMVSDDINDFFDVFGKTFNINGDGYNYYNYFHEDVHPLHILRNTLNYLFRPEKVQKKNLTIGHLVKVAERGFWFDPE